MFQYDEEEENIILCVNCDAEYTITKIDDEEHKKKKNLPKEEDKYKQYINHLYEEEKVMGYYAGDNLFARV